MFSDAVNKGMYVNFVVGPEAAQTKFRVRK